MRASVRAVRRSGLSVVRKTYLFRLAARCVLAVSGVWLLLWDPAQADILRGWNFFRRLSPFHLLWALWTADILWQLFPGGFRVALGSRKLFRAAYRPAGGMRDRQRVRDVLTISTRRAYGGVFLVWAAFAAVLFRLKASGWVHDAGLLAVSLAFYVCDLVCVLIWCPFRLMLGNRCCTTCRIFNWDHLMMFSPMLPVRGFFSVSLIVLSAAAFLAWEVCVLRYPERFLAETNAALRCDRCTDKLCIQYCEKRLF